MKTITGIMEKKMTGQMTNGAKTRAGEKKKSGDCAAAISFLVIETRYFGSRS